MSYCRFGWDGSDVYVIDHVGGYIRCYCDRPGNQADTPEEMIAHLAQHKRDGDFVPDYAITGLFADVPGPNTPVRPEPQSMTDAKRLLAQNAPPEVSE